MSIATELDHTVMLVDADVARPGVKECEVYGAMMNAMVSNGGEEPTLFLWKDRKSVV